MRILIASDKYKGSLTAAQVAITIASVLAEEIPGAVCDMCPIADGGEGTAEAMVTAQKGEWVDVSTWDAQGRPRVARYGLCNGQAVMEMSAASGLALVNDLPLAPETASSYGTGVMLKHALQRDARSVVIGIGGSATNDGGLGLAAALGYRFLDAQRQILEPFIREMDHLEAIQRPPFLEKVGSDAGLCPILVACDVDNLLLGETGATRVYGPQKGVQDFAWFEKRLQRLADVVAHDLGCDPRAVPGAGAAGGLGWGLMAFCGAQLTNGFDLVSEQIGLEARVALADLVITGEGRLDSQTLHGKGPVGIAQMARRLGKPVVAFAGAVEDSSALQAHFDFTRATKPADMPLGEAIARAEELLALAVRERAGAIRELLGR